MKSSAFKVLLIGLVLCTALHFSHGEEAKKNKFREREASDDALGYPNLYDCCPFVCILPQFTFCLSLIAGIIVQRFVICL